MSLPPPNDSGTQPFVFGVLNRLDVILDGEVELLPGHFFRRATPAEAVRFRDGFRSMGPRIDPELVYENRMIPLTSQSGQAFDYGPLLEPEWKYYVIEARDRSTLVNEGIQAIERAAMLSRVELKAPLHLYPGGGSAWLSRRSVDPFEVPGMWTPEGELFNLDTVHTIQAIHGRLVDVEARHEDIKRVIAMLRALDGIAPDQSLYLLGLFAILEALMTHNPHGRYDALTHQIKNKMRLLEERFDERPTTLAFVGLSPDDLWPKLYKLRSVIAHGGTLRFTDDFRHLRGLSEVSHFLRASVKALLRYALVEPRLVLHLRDC